MIVRYLVGAAELHVGNVQDAMRHLEEALPLYDEEACRPFAFVGGPHVYAFTLIWLGLARLYAGFPERGKETMLEAVRDARRRSHPFTLVSALLAQSRFLIHVGDVRAAIDATEEGHAIATEQRSPYHVSRANVLRAVNLIESGDPQSGIALMHRALDAHRATGANYQSSFNLSYLALAHSRAGDHQRAFAVATDAVAEVERTGERWWEAEAHRIRGEIIRATTPARWVDAECHFREARDCAHRQGARFWERRAAESLARR
jgi:tetratricopeptide (TPR) repeat protein